MSFSVWIGALLGAWIAIASLYVTGAGHGWTSGIYAVFAAIGAPIAFYLISTPKLVARRSLGYALTLYAIAVDILLVLTTRSEGIEYLHKMFERNPLFIVFVWGTPFVLWHIAVAIACFPKLQVWKWLKRDTSRSWQ